MTGKALIRMSVQGCSLGGTKEARKEGGELRANIGQQLMGAVAF